MIDGLRLLETGLGDLKGPARKPPNPKSARQSRLGQYATMVMKPHCPPWTAWRSITAERRLQMLLGFPLIARVMIRASQEPVGDHRVGRITGAWCNRAVQIKVAVGVLIRADRLRAACGKAPPDRVQPQAAFVHCPHDDGLVRPRRNNRLHLRAKGSAKGGNGLSVFFDATGAGP